MNHNFHLSASIHTLTIKTKSVVPEAVDYGAGVESIRTDHKSGTTFIKINPNKYAGDIYEYSKCVNVLDKIIYDCGLTMTDSFQLSRMDLRLDSDEDDFYRTHLKPVRLLLSAVALTYKVPNKYITRDLFSEDPLSIAIVTPHFEAEYYDKSVESQGRDSAKARLELRTKRWSIKQECIPCEFLEHWPKILYKSMNNFDQTLSKYNESLAKQYWEETNTEKGSSNSYIAFVGANKSRIFTRLQLIDLLRTIKIVNPEVAADNYIRRHNIELIKEPDVEVVIEEIIRATDEFFGR